jgi:hypothetical protein
MSTELEDIRSKLQDAISALKLIEKELRMNKDTAVYAIADGALSWIGVHERNE